MFATSLFLRHISVGTCMYEEQCMYNICTVMYCTCRLVHYKVTIAIVVIPPVCNSAISKASKYWHDSSQSQVVPSNPSLLSCTVTIGHHSTNPTCKKVMANLWWTCDGTQRSINRIWRLSTIQKKNQLPPLF
jgi:hypothetical protein